jgi:hypothetical protein
MQATHHTKTRTHVRYTRNGIILLPDLKPVQQDPLRARITLFMEGEDAMLRSYCDGYFDDDEDYLFVAELFASSACYEPEPIEIDKPHQKDLDRIRHQRRFQPRNTSGKNNLRHWKGRTYRGRRNQCPGTPAYTRRWDVAYHMEEQERLDDKRARKCASYVGDDGRRRDQPIYRLEICGYGTACTEGDEFAFAQRNHVNANAVTSTVKVAHGLHERLAQRQMEKSHVIQT